MPSSSIAQAGARPESPSAAVLSRWLLPSLSDLFFFLVIAWSFLAGENGWVRLLMDASTGIHIRAGDFILSNHQVPHTDLFSFTAAGKPWFAFEWLAETIFSAAHSEWGLKGVVLLVGLLLAGFLTVLFRSMLARGTNAWLAIILTLLTANASNIEFHARPHVFTFFLFTIATAMVASDRANPSRLLWLLIPLTAIWTNLHGGFFVLFPFLGVTIAGALAEAWLSPEVRTERLASARRYGALLAGCGLASMLNPYGIGLHEHVLFTVQDKWTATFVGEFKSPSFRSEMMLLYMAVLFLALGVCGLLLMRRRITSALYIVFFGYASLSAVRHVPLFLIVVAPIVGEELTYWWDRWAETQPRKSAASVLNEIAAGLTQGACRTSLWMPAGIVLLFLASGLAWPTSFPAEILPVKIIDHHRDFLAQARIFTSDQWADLLIYMNYPRQRVFMDDRHQFYGEKIGNDYLALQDGQRPWLEIVNRYRVNAILCPPKNALASILRERADWSIVEEDSVGVLFARKAQ